MAQKLNIFSGRQFLDSSGDPYVGAQLFSYVAGSSTKVTLTKDSAGASNHANPVILNARGEPADGSGASQAMWQAEGVTVKLVLAPAGDTDPPVAAISTWDNLSGINDSAASSVQDEWVSGNTPTYVSTTSFALVGDQTSDFHVGRRLKTTNSGGTLYSTIKASVFTSLTTVTVANDSTALDSGLSAVSYAVISAVDSSSPAVLNHTISLSKGADIASATALVTGNDGNYFDVTGTTDITSINAIGIGTILKLHFDGALTLTHDATNLILPRGHDIVTVAGDEVELIEYAEGDFILTSHVKNNGLIDGHFKTAPWTRWLGDDSDGSLTYSSTTDIASDERFCSALDVQVGTTLGVSEASNGFLIFRCSGTATIAGILDLDGKGGVGGAGHVATVNIAGVDGDAAILGGAAGGGVGSSTPLDGGDGGSSYRGDDGGAGSALHSTDATAGTALTTQTESFMERHAGTLYPTYLVNGLIGGAGGGGGAVGGTNTTSGSGGDGGGAIIIIADQIDFTGTITCDGADGENSSHSTAGSGGGGGGGFVLLVARNFIANTGTITVTGGTGGVIVTYNGGDGADGHSASITAS